MPAKTSSIHGRRRTKGTPFRGLKLSLWSCVAFGNRRSSNVFRLSCARFDAVPWKLLFQWRGRCCRSLCLSPPSQSGNSRKKKTARSLHPTPSKPRRTVRRCQTTATRPKNLEQVTASRKQSRSHISASSPDPPPPTPHVSIFRVYFQERNALTERTYGKGYPLAPCRSAARMPGVSTKLM